MNRKKIVYIIGQLGKGGAEKQLYELVKGLDKDRFAPIVISLSQGGYWVRELRKCNIQLIELPRKKGKEIKRLFRLIKIIKSIKPDIVHTYLYSANSYGRIAAVITRVPVIIASERSFPEIGKDKSRSHFFIDKLLASFSHGIICNTYKASEHLVNKYAFNAKKIFTVHNGFDATNFLKETETYFSNQKMSKQKMVGTIGNLYPVKNHKLFLDMAKIVLRKAEREKVKFVIVGKGILKGELVEYCRNLRIENEIVFTGQRNDVPDLLQMMDVFVLTSKWEGLSNAIMEAMASGLPCVVTDVGGNGELVVDRETGYLVPPNDPETMAQKILCLFKNESLRKKMGLAGKRRIEKDFRVDKMVRETEKVYKKLLLTKE